MIFVIENLTDSIIENINTGVNGSNQDGYEVYREIEKEQFIVSKLVAFIIGTIIMLTNLIVVISSGLILKTGQQPKSTYLLLGNMSLADTVLGFSLIMYLIDNSMRSHIWCVTQLGMLVCTAMVSIFSVGLIAVDRYIYIIHGLYYHRWFNTTRVRIGILCIWAIGITLGFMPATGWTNHELLLTRCYYVALYPGSLILLISLLSYVPIIIVAVLYSIILVRALKNIKTLNTTKKNLEKTSAEKPNLRIYRGTVYDKKSSTHSIPSTIKRSADMKFNRSASLNLNLCKDFTAKDKSMSMKSKSIDNFINDKANKKQEHHTHYKNQNIIKGKTYYESNYSVYTVESNYSVKNLSETEVNTASNESIVDPSKRIQTNRKAKDPNKWRAITVVMLTSGSFIITWIPYFITVNFFVFCENKLTNTKCMYIRALLGGPLPTLAFFNSILNPLIYAWWHKGFKRSIKRYYKKYLGT